jgi:putative endonuclease
VASGSPAKAPNERQTLGAFGERLAEQHLLANGYRILDRNVRMREGEIDIVAQYGDTLAFVEVRTRRGHRLGSAIESITYRKAQRMYALAEAFLAAHEGLPEGRRVDVIAIDFTPDGRLGSLRHFESAVTGD